MDCTPNNGSEIEQITSEVLPAESTPISSTSGVEATNSEAEPASSEKTANKACLSRFKYQVQSNLVAIIHEKEQHNTRLHNLRKELNHIKSTDWQYQPIEKLIGRNNQ